LGRAALGRVGQQVQHQLARLRRIDAGGGQIRGELEPNGELRGRQRDLRRGLARDRDEIGAGARRDGAARVGEHLPAHLGRAAAGPLDLVEVPRGRPLFR
jgi:hypothetical protein